jgi:hypothetical protein
MPQQHECRGDGWDIAGGSLGGRGHRCLFLVTRIRDILLAQIELFFEPAARFVRQFVGAIETVDRLPFRRDQLKVDLVSKLGEFALRLRVAAKNSLGRSRKR